MPHRLFEDRRVRRDAGQAVLVDQLLETTGLQELPVDEIEPYRLAEAFEIVERTHHLVSITWRATLTTLSTVNPNLSCNLASGAEAPKVDIVTVAPSRPT